MEHNKFMYQSIRAEEKPFIWLNLHIPHLVCSSTGIHITIFLCINRNLNHDHFAITSHKCIVKYYERYETFTIYLKDKFTDSTMCVLGIDQCTSIPIEQNCVKRIF